MAAKKGRKKSARRRPIGTRVHAPSMRTHRKPSKRLMRRRARNRVPGYYPNPVRPLRRFRARAMPLAKEMTRYGVRVYSPQHAVPLYYSGKVKDGQPVWTKNAKDAATFRTNAAALEAAKAARNALPANVRERVTFAVTPI